MKRKKKEAWIKKFLKLSMLLATALVIYAMFFWKENSPPEKKITSNSTKPSMQTVLQSVQKQLEKEKNLVHQQLKPTLKKIQNTLQNAVQKSQKLPTITTKPTLKKNILRYTIQPGDSLWILGKRFYGSGYRGGKKIFEFNRHIIKNKNVLPVGKTILLPNVKNKKLLLTQHQNDKIAQKLKKGKVRYETYLTQSDDTLSAIAEDYYNNPKMWRAIWLANKHKIKNPNILPKGIKIRIPLFSKKD